MDVPVRLPRNPWTDLCDLLFQSPDHREMERLTIAEKEQFQKHRMLSICENSRVIRIVRLLQRMFSTMLCCFVLRENWFTSKQQKVLLIFV